MFSVFVDVSVYSLLFFFLILESKGNNHYGYCQAGFSAEYTVDGYDVIMGTVGVKRWKGIHFVCVLVVGRCGGLYC